jgi:membrane fusion protein, multidrug efflux system
MNRGVAVGLGIGCLLLGSAGAGQVRPLPAPSPAVPLTVSAAQANVRSLEKWLPVKAEVIALPAPAQARLAFNQQQSSSAPIKIGQAVRVPVPPPRSGYVPGAVDRVSQGALPGTLRVELLVQNPDQAFGLGQSALAEVQVIKRPNTLVAPAAAVFEEGDQTFVFKLDQGSGRAKVQKVPVRVGYGDGEWTEIRLGLWPGQWLAASNLNLLADGVTVLVNPR